MDPSIDKAQAFLQGRGFHCEYEPPWVIKGRKPDFFCQGTASIWVEVKTLSDTPRGQALDYFCREFQRRACSIPDAWGISVLVSESAADKDIKVSMKLAEIALALQNANQQTWNRVIALIPHNPVYGQTVRFTVQETEGSVLFVSCKARSGKYCLPPNVEPSSYEELISVIADNTCLDPVPLDDLIESSLPLIALELVLEPHWLHVELMESDWRLQNVERLRACVKDKNSQLRNGQRYKPAPSVLLIYQEDLLVPADTMVLTALYGDLTYAFPKGPHTGPLSYSRNGAFRPDKNTAVSALCLNRNDSSPFTVHNYWGHLPLPSGLLGGTEFILREDGSFSSS